MAKNERSGTAGKKPVRRRFLVSGPGRRRSVMRISVLGLIPALALGIAVGGIGTLYQDEPSVMPVVSADTQFTLSGHGNGHGRGMGQWGAYGYAKNQGWSGERILSHYYGGTVLDSMPPAQMSVRLTARDDETLDVYSAAGMVVNGQRTAPGEAAHLTALPGGGASVVVTSGCGGGVVWEAVTNHPWVDPVDLSPDRPADQFLTMCDDNAPYRGALGVVLDNGAARTVNLLDMEDYLLGVVPVEAKADWADSGGAEALRAQAVAARSYAAVEHRSSYADTCDTQDCQVYGGAGKEDPRTTEAVRSTTGAVLSRDGDIVATEFSSSTGGYSSGGAFPAVADEGDTISPNHDWTQMFSAGEIAEAFGVGELTSLKVLSRNGLGVDGGRVTALEVVGTKATVGVTGMQARMKLGLKSDWFTIGDGAGVVESPVSETVAPELNSQITDSSGTVVETQIEAKYREFGGATGTLGAPVGPEMQLPSEAGTFRVFENGTIIWTEILGAQVVDANVLREWIPTDMS
ncbi:stage II sporulation protein [Rhodococcus sp. ACPA4]|uniref:SpoIID/LytB domain-containing protein n=1 Tax=unclassified Rhodococcus (in: high G+C Gram-positive bacteria) TaxID=192944 RepID=UPI0005D3A1FC|nr:MULTISPECIES: SpoIID/LytB domain-containing protein [unclassified Rhodococcus (in: high G+C Gram-positive bacteria)]KJF25099.1 Modifier protein of major autolysin [Rhodococcus sp. AD45]PBC43873.1 stage II sporulation protein [Rhodococcus sp. ACPA4]PSR43299.1 SpoIID/LytB domain-containing protein [Rhodococcus sp. AD45-ID]